MQLVDDRSSVDVGKAALARTLVLSPFGSLLLHVFGKTDTVVGKDRSNVSKCNEA